MGGGGGFSCTGSTLYFLSWLSLNVQQICLYSSNSNSTAFGQQNQMILYGLGHGCCSYLEKCFDLHMVMAGLIHLTLCGPQHQGFFTFTSCLSTLSVCHVSHRGGPGHSAGSTAIVQWMLCHPGSESPYAAIGPARTLMDDTVWIIGQDWMGCNQWMCM